jgi:DNA mismatch repair protein MutL
MSISILPDSVIAQIAAGEVVERPTSVVKELIENSIDAGAKNIRVEVTGGGRQRIRVGDDGDGIPGDDVEVAFYRHATSKLKSADDLLSIQTLGFRGEALASIASVSQLTIVTRHINAAKGVSLVLGGGQLIHRQSIGAPSGTIVTVENLFYNTPARLKFLKKESTEKRHIALLITRYAMAYPLIRFTLVQDGHETFRSGGSGHLADVLVAVLGIDSFKNMVEVSEEHLSESTKPAVNVFGYTSAPSLHRSDRNHITLFVNGRWIQDTRLSFAVTQAYHTFLMTGRYPVAVLMLSVELSEVDVNVHPTKAEVRFRDTDSIFSAIQRAVRRAIVNLAQTPTMRRGWISGHWVENGDTPARSREYLQHENKQSAMAFDLFEPGQFRRSSLNVSINNQFDPQASTVLESEDLHFKPRTLPILRVIGQVAATYIVAEGPSGLYLIDQHAAHERILYEEFTEELASKDIASQLTLDAQTIHLTPPETRLLEEYLSILQSYGFDIETFGPNVFIVRGVPSILTDQPPAEVIREIIGNLESDQDPSKKAIEDKVITHICKRAAIKAGQILSQDEMQSIVRRLERCHSPHTCPHGRPTMLHMTGEQIAREFGRLG